MDIAENTLDRWRKLKDIFSRAAELDSDSRLEYLSSIRVNERTLYQQVIELLQAENEASSFLQTPISFDINCSLIGQMIGHYKIESEVGRGGMGTVFEAVRQDGEFEHKVAIKLTSYSIFSGELIKRFRAERQILAKLEHKNIVRLLDGGITDRQIPFYVMEYVEGKPINDFCAENNLQINEILALFLQICEAVAYAHRQLIVHRDLKPSNILVTRSGEVKLLDFGIAKVLEEDSQTLASNAPLTPEYASPEQVKGEPISTATDIYSLGIILYELLTGHAPCEIYRTSRSEIHRAVCEVEPNRPSNYQNSKTQYKTKVSPNLLKGDLDNIILKSLRKETELRYESVEKFADDIKAYLWGLPVKAHPQSFGYRAGKFFKRNRLLVAGTTVSILLILLGATIAVRQSFIAQNQQQIAEQRFDQVRKIAHSMIFDYYDEITKIDGSVELREKLVADAIDYLNAIAREGNNNPELMKETAVAFRKIGDVQGKPYDSNRGNLEEALKSYEKSVALLKNASIILPNDISLKEELVISYRSLAQAANVANRNADAKSALQNAFSVNKELTSLDENNLDRKISALILVAILGDIESDLQIKLNLYKQNLTDANSLFLIHTDSSRLAQLLATLNSRTGNVLRWLGDEEEEKGNNQPAQNYYRQAVEHSYETLRYDELFQSMNPDGIFNKSYRFVTYRNIAVNLAKIGQIEKAVENLKLAEKLHNEMARDDPDNRKDASTTLDIYFTKYLILLKQENFNSALKIVKSGLKLAEESYRKDIVNVELLSLSGFFAKAAADIYNLLDNENEAKNYRQIYQKYAREYFEKFGSEMRMNF